MADPKSSLIVGMEVEVLIDYVRTYKELYDPYHQRYNDHRHKSRIWKEIEKHMNKPASECKRTWFNLRDAYRRSLKKRKLRNLRSHNVSATVSKPSTNLKWRYEDHMSFLVPFIQEKPNANYIISLPPPAPPAPPPIPMVEQPTTLKVEEDGTGVASSTAVVSRTTATEPEENNNLMELEMPNVNVSPVSIAHSGSGCCMHGNGHGNGMDRNGTDDRCYPFIPVRLLNASEENKREEPCHHDAIELFFKSICATVKTFTPYHQNVVKSKIFSTVSEVEMQQLIQQNQSANSAVVHHDSFSVSFNQSTYESSPMNNVLPTEFLQELNPYDTAPPSSPSVASS